MATVKQKGQEVNIEDLPVDQLEQLLKQKKKAQADARQKKRALYEQKREQLINELGGFALSLSGQMQDLKFEAMRDLIQFREEMKEYGYLRRGENNKGSFRIQNEKYRITFTSQICKSFDERAQIAETHLKTFMEGFVKKKDRTLYDLIAAVMKKKTKTGDYDIDLISRLYSIEDRFDNPDWKEALRLFKESYNPVTTSQYIKFEIKNAATNSWDSIVLDFARIKGTDMPLESKQEE